MLTNKKMATRAMMALAVSLVFVAGARAGTPDRIFRFGEDPMETPTLGGTPSAGPLGPLTLDSQIFNTSGFSDASDLSFNGGPTYFNAGSGPLARPGAAAGSFGLQFNGTSDRLFDSAGSLGVPAQGDDLYTPGTNNAPGYATITTRYIEGWVRPTGGAGTRRDIINDSARFGIFIGADNNWGFLNGTTTVNTTTPATLNQWTHVMHRTNGATGGAVLLVNGVAVAATPAGYATGNQAGQALDLVMAAGLNQTSNFFAGQLDNFSIGVAGDNTGQPGGRNYGPVDLNTDNDFVKQTLATVNRGDINRNGTVGNDDVTLLVSNWRRVNRLNGVIVGDLNTRAFGDLNMNGAVDIDDAYSLHAALRVAGGAGLNLAALGITTPEPGSIALFAGGLAMLSLGWPRRGRLSDNESQE